MCLLGLVWSQERGKLLDKNECLKLGRGACISVVPAVNPRFYSDDHYVLIKYNATSSTVVSEDSLSKVIVPTLSKVVMKSMSVKEKWLWCRHPALSAPCDVGGAQMFLIPIRRRCIVLVKKRFLSLMLPYSIHSADMKIIGDLVRRLRTHRDG